MRVDCVQASTTAIVSRAADEIRINPITGIPSKWYFGHVKARDMCIRRYDRDLLAANIKSYEGDLLVTSMLHKNVPAAKYCNEYDSLMNDYLSIDGKSPLAAVWVCTAICAVFVGCGRCLAMQISPFSKGVNVLSITEPFLILDSLDSLATNVTKTRYSKFSCDEPFQRPITCHDRFSISYFPN